MSGRFRGGGGGKKGPRHHNGSFKNKAKLRPPPVQSQRPDASCSTSTKTGSSKSKGKARALPNVRENEENGEENQAGDEEEDEFGYREDLKDEAKPLAGAIVSVTGCPEIKNELLDLANELGGTGDNSLTQLTTHLIADGPGTEKYDVALQYGMKVMSRDWLPAVRDAWVSAESIDFFAIENEHRLPAFSSVQVCLTGFARGPHKEEFRNLIASHGAYVSPKLTSHTTHLIVASPDSPHSQEHFEKLHQARKDNENIKIVWEGWAYEVIDYRGIRSERERLWLWRGGQAGPPSAEELKEPDWRASSRAKAPKRMDTLVVPGAIPQQAQSETPQLSVAITSASTGQRPLGDNRTLDLDDASEAQVVAQRKPKSRAGARGISDVNDIISNYTQRNPESQDAPISIAAAAKPRTLVMELDDPAQHAPKKSIIKAVSSARAEVLTRLERGREPQGNASGSTRPQSPSPEPPSASAADDSAFFESVVEIPSKGEMEDESVPGEAEDQIFEGSTFSLMELENRASVVFEAITTRGGTVWLNENEEMADWVIVPAFGAPAKYWSSSDPRVVTHIWIENCLYEEALVPPSNRLLERPFAGITPVPGCSSLAVHMSGFSEVEKSHIHTFVVRLGGSINENFDRSCSHIIHASENPSGAKVEKARLWGIPVVGLEWLEKYAREQANEESLKQKNSSCSTVDQENDADGRRPLDGCSVAFSSKVKCDQPKLSKLIKVLGGNVEKSSSTTVTHLIHQSTKSSDALKELKNRSTNLLVVHPQWIEECSRLHARANESDFPAQYDIKKSHQLAGLVMSPPHPTASRQRSVGTASPSGSLRRSPSKQPHLPEEASPSPSPSPSKNQSRRTRPSGSLREDDSPSAMQEGTNITRPNEKDLEEAARPAFTYQIEPTTSSAPQQDFHSDPSSDHPEDQPDIKPAPRDLLKEQTSALLASIEQEASEDPATKRKARFLSRKKSTNENLTGSTSSDHSLILQSDEPRRIPGFGYDPNQATQTEEYSMDVTFEDPAAARAREQILAAIANGANGGENAQDDSDSPRGAAKRGQKRSMDGEEQESQGDDVIVLADVPTKRALRRKR